MCTHFLANYAVDVDKMYLLPQAVGLLKLMLTSFCIINIQRRKLCLGDFIRYTFNIGLLSNTYETIAFKLAVMLDTTKLSSFIWVWKILTFIQGHWVTRRRSVVRRCKAAQIFVMADYEREMTAKKSCKCFEYGSFDHVLILFSVLLSFILHTKSAVIHGIINKYL